MEEKKNIVLLDDHVLVRNGLKELIEKLGSYQISKQFDNGRDFLKSMQEKPQPDLAILDINMPGMNGDEVMEKLNEQGNKTPVLILTVNENEEMIIKLFRLGVRGYLMKNCKASELKNALNSIFTSGYYHNEFLANSLRSDKKVGKKGESEAVLNKLSPREREFLKLVCHEKEYTYDRIAEMMGVSPKTIDGYREEIFEKFKIKSKTGLVLFVLRNKLFDYL